MVASLSAAALALALGGPSSSRPPASPLVVPSSAFAQQLGYRTVTATTFEGAPLSTHDSKTRGAVLTAFARRCDEELHPGVVFEEAVAGTRVDGKRRGQDKAVYDWQRDGRRVACKSAGLKWNRDKEYWTLQFRNVKLATAGERDAAFDELLLAAYTPEGVHVFRHDLRAGVSTTGKSMAATGKEVNFYGPSHEPDWRVALGEILGKVEAKGCRPLAFVPWDEAEASSQRAA